MSDEVVRRIKAEQLDRLNDWRQELCVHPMLRELFLELTLRCNEECFHCGSRCTADAPDGLALEEYKAILDEVKENFDLSDLRLSVTGGEPMLYPHFYELMSYANQLGFRWGMTSNATLITKEAAKKLHECGMRTISVSIDGLEETHDRQRRRKGSWRRAMEGIQNLIDEGGFRVIQVTSVMNHQNLGELDAMYRIFEKMEIDSWRVIGIEPIGRALDYPEMLLTREDQRRLFEFIREKRLQQMPVTYGCSHYLGLDLEREVRRWYFLCNAGVYVAGIRVNGDIGACLDIEAREETIQGNVRTDSFTDVWNNRFEIFRQRLSKRNETCQACPAEKWCAGGAFHSWDFDRNEPRICMRNILFEEV